MKLGNNDRLEGPSGNTVVKGQSESIFDAAEEVAREGVTVLSLSKMLEEDRGNGDQRDGGTEGPTSARLLFRERGSPAHC